LQSLKTDTMPGVRRWSPALAGAIIAAALCGPPGPTGEAPDDLMLLTLAPPALEPVGGAPAAGLRIALGDARGGEPTLLSGGFWEARSPSPSFDGRHFLFQGRQRRSDDPSIWERRMNGSGKRHITDGNGHPDHPAYLPDGRIVYSDRPQGDGERELDVRALFSCAADGSDTRRLTFGWHLDTRPEVLPDGRVRFQRRPLGADALDEPRFMTIRPDGTGIAPWAGELCGCDHPVPDQLTAGELGGDVLRADPAAPRERPPILTSVVQEEKENGTLLCLNVYESRLPEVAMLPAGAIRQVRVAAVGPPASVSGGMSEWPAAVGMTDGEPFVALAPVHADGSFMVEVPADTPLRIDLIDEREQVLAALTSGLWVRPNENRGCIGCHENPEIAPGNRLPLAVSVTSGAARDGAVAVQDDDAAAASAAGGSGAR
jgi:hypothetical protein